MRLKQQQKNVKYKQHCELTGDQFVDHFPWHSPVAVSSFDSHDQGTNGIVLAHHARQRVEEFRRAVLNVRHFDFYPRGLIVQSILRGKFIRIYVKVVGRSWIRFRVTIRPAVLRRPQSALLSAILIPTISPVS